MKIRYTATCLFGLEHLLGEEIDALGYDREETMDGRVTFLGDEETVALANVFLRYAERVYITLGSFPAATFDEVFEGVRALPLETWIGRNDAFPVKGHSIRSGLSSLPALQSVIKKAAVERLSACYGLTHFPEEGIKYQLEFFLFKDQLTLMIDTSGVPLHKRGYRPEANAAPLRETLAAAMAAYSRPREEVLLWDPMCGSGTFVIEAAMIAANIAPGMDRAFVSEAWTNLIDKKCWYNALDEANEAVDQTLLETGVNRFGKKVDIQGYDINPEVIPVARENAERAGVDKIVHLQVRDIANFSHSGKFGYILTNPPYGERIEDKRNLPLLYTELKEAYQGLDSWSMHLITAWEDAQKYLGKADKNRKIYNGMMKTYFYSYDKRYIQHSAPHDFRGKPGAAEQAKR